MTNCKGGMCKRRKGEGGGFHRKKNVSQLKDVAGICTQKCRASPDCGKAASGRFGIAGKKLLSIAAGGDIQRTLADRFRFKKGVTTPEYKLRIQNLRKGLVEKGKGPA